MPARHRRPAIADDACLHEERRQDLPFLGHRAPLRLCRHGVALLESLRLHAARPPRPRHATAEFPLALSRRALSGSGIGSAFVARIPQLAMAALEAAIQPVSP